MSGGNGGQVAESRVREEGRIKWISMTACDLCHRRIKPSVARPSGVMPLGCERLKAARMRTAYCR